MVSASRSIKLKLSSIFAVHELDQRQEVRARTHTHTGLGRCGRF